MSIEHINKSHTLPISVETLIVPRTTDLGDGFSVRRALPATERRMVGPFVFLDEMGPAVFEKGKGLDVRPHPHIGLATVTYLFQGEIMHRDSLGTVQSIRPGELNLMTAGQGIVHSERTPQELRQKPSSLSGLQCWVALPERYEETQPDFAHFNQNALPLTEGEGIWARVILGNIFGLQSPAQTHSDMIFAEIVLESSISITIPADYEERALYIVGGQINLAQDGFFEPNQLVVLKPGAPVTVSAGATSPARLILVGGETMDKPRHLWWNFVSSSKDRIEQAKSDWLAGRFPLVPDETEFIPLPADKTKPPPVLYP
jgi:redox-sensitive bicupin YhaK (pirin superfamily)